MKKVLVIAAHPDDELLGCGATVALHAASGDEVRSIILCEGETMRNQQICEKANAIKKSAEILGCKVPICIGLPDQHLDTIPIVDIISPIEKVVQDYQPNIIYCHFGKDLNRDHQLVFEAAMVALRPKNEFIEAIYSFYIVGSTEWNYPRAFEPDTWVGFHKEILNRKLKAFACYETEQYDYPNPRSIEALENLAKTTGNQCCMEYAEAFVTVRKIVRGKIYDI